VTSSESSSGGIIQRLNIDRPYRQFIQSVLHVHTQTCKHTNTHATSSTQKWTCMHSCTFTCMHRQIWCYYCCLFICCCSTLRHRISTHNHLNNPEAGERWVVLFVVVILLFVLEGGISGGSCLCEIFEVCIAWFY